MSNGVRYFLLGLIALVIVIGAALLYVKLLLPNVGPAADIKIEYTPERIAKGKYLANSVTVCMDCHSKRDFTKFSGPIVPGTFGMGGEKFDQSSGLPGVFYSGNITPDGIGRYTDGELVRVITTGVNKEGKAMFPLMPYPYYGRMDTEDIYCIVAYIRSIQPIQNDVPASSPDFPVNFIVNTIPKKATPVARPDTSDVLAYGQYITNASACRECHSPAKNGQVITELAWSGGREFLFPNGTKIVSSNLTPHSGTGIGKWSKEAFIARFKLYADSSFTPPPVASGEMNTVMPWMMYCRMKESDLVAIYNYLKTVKPISNKVVKFIPASEVE